MNTTRWLRAVPVLLVALGLALRPTAAADEPEPPAPVEPAADPAPGGAAPEEAAAEVPAAESVVMDIDEPAPVENGRSEVISITLRDTPLSDVVNLFVRTTGANIIAAPEDLTGRVTVSIRDMPWREALESILDIHGLTLERSSVDVDLFRIVPRPEGAPEPMAVASFELQFIRATDHDRALIRGIERLLAPNGSVLYAGGNRISILGTTRQIELVSHMIERVDQRVPQVVIEAKFVELNDEAIRDLGINWQVLQGYTAGVGDLTWGFGTNREITDRITGRVADSDDTQRFFDIRGRQFEEEEATEVREMPPGSGNFIMTTRRTPTREILGTRARDATRTDERAYTEFQSAVLTADAFALTLSALQQSAGTGIISNPRIIVASGQTASIHVGQQDPEIKAVADTNLGGRLTYQREAWIESGVKLDVTPVVNTEEIISVQIRPELSRVIGFVETGDSRVTIPRLSTRTITSHFHLPSGRTVAIGGLTETQDRDTVNKVPFLGDIPLLGRLFRHQSTRRSQEEVIIFVTLALADAEGLAGDSGIPTQGELIHRRVAADEGVLRLTGQEPERRRRRPRETDPHAPVPRD